MDLSGAPVNTIVLAKTPKSRKRSPKGKKDVKLVLTETSEKTIAATTDAPDRVLLEIPEKPVSQRVQTAREGRRSRMPKPGQPGAVQVSEVTTTDIKDKNPLAVRDQLMREYFALRNSTDDVVQKLCALVFKHH